MIDIICPLSLQPLSPLSLGTACVYSASPSKDQKCGHSCSLVHLTSHLETSNLCPVCLNDEIRFICDGVSNAHLLAVVKSTGESNPVGQCSSFNESHDFICFKYGKHAYYLALKKNDRENVITRIFSIFRKTDVTSLAQERIADVFSLNPRTGLKILYKGRVIYPDKFCSSCDISQKIITISKADLHDVIRKKPTLVVMGTRIGMEIKNELSSEKNGIMRSIMSRGGTPIYGSLKGLFGAFYYLFKSFLIPSSDLRYGE